ncbi:cell wall-binding repeat-containing protein [Embleya sp. NBC_00896]|uniref:cell wall-binding repeat-containing protein n=1 Tax=Embleya sp. NBC_00896 TaxID=2975961 RepID=UPI00386B2ECE|nr:cell wall-binding repeat-containing protein [Embleya sp. NBC_00896]
MCTTAALALTATVVAMPVAQAVRPTQAAPGDPVELVYTSGWVSGGFGLLRADGGGGRSPVAETGLNTLDAVSKDGKRLAGRSSAANDFRYRTVDADGTRAAHIVVPRGHGQDSAFSPDGSTLYLSGDVVGDHTGTQSQLLTAPADRDATAQPLLPAQTISCDRFLSTSTGRYAFSRKAPIGDRCGGASSVMLYTPGTGAVETAVELNDAGVEVPVEGVFPSISPDGTRLVYMRMLPGGERAELRVLDLATKRSKAVYEDSNLWPARWSPDGRFLAFGVFNVSKRLDLVTGAVNLIGPNGGEVQPIWANRTVTPSVGVRVHGANAIETGVATSRFKYDAAGTATGARKAKVAVLTRSDAFYDGLAGAGLAGAKGGPMLLTPKAGLAPAVSAELARILAPGAMVYVLGGADVVSTAVDNQVRALGFVPRRLEGDAVADTGVAIANEMTTAPKRVLVATAEEHYDALAAGAAAGSRSDTTVVFTWGETLPQATEDYLRSLDRSVTKVTAVGGPAVTALEDAGLPADLTANGTDAADTARLLATGFIDRPKAAALVNQESWQDALTGGALIAGHGPLLLTTEDGLPEATTDYLTTTAPSLDRLVIVGGQSAVGDAQAREATALTEPGAMYDFVDSPNGDVKVPLG